jgi:hypothetical protein
MRIPLMFIFLILLLIKLDGQNLPGQEGVVSYITSQSVYVRFTSTGNIRTGDTLFILKGDKLIPVLQVRELSSISCVCNLISDIKLSVSDKIVHQSRQAAEPESKPAVPLPVIKPTEPESVKAPMPVETKDTLKDVRPEQKAKRQQIHGYFAIASYSNFSDQNSTNSQKMKYTFSFLGKNLGNTNLSAECYINFVHSNQQWEEIKKDIFNGLKIYNLALTYDFGRKASFLLGRKINPKLSNMGANDGLQFELRFRSVAFGIIAGFRPDYYDYGFNANLFQAGGYLYHELTGKHGTMQTTLAFVEQMNSWKTDRRFLYLQHVNSLVKNLTFFGSAELDLFRQTLNTQDSTYSPQNTFHLTNLYLSLNYRVIKQLTLSFSYSARQNIIYYETYKNWLDELLDSETLQGYLLQVAVRPVKKMSIGATGGYRFQKDDPGPTKNLYGYFTYSQIPGIGISTTLSLTLLQTGYLNGNIYGIGISRDFFRGKLYFGLGYRYVDYRYHESGPAVVQHLAEANLTWRIYRKISISCYYEGTFEQQDQFNRIYGQLNVGF